MPLPVCRVCNDTHIVHCEWNGTSQMCTSCPVPCQVCRKNGTGPYCTTTPCACPCHAGKYVKLAREDRLVTLNLTLPMWAMNALLKGFDHANHDRGGAEHDAIVKKLKEALP